MENSSPIIHSQMWQLQLVARQITVLYTINLWPTLLITPYLWVILFWQERAKCKDGSLSVFLPQKFELKPSICPGLGMYLRSHQNKFKIYMSIFQKWRGVFVFKNAIRPFLLWYHISIWLYDHILAMLNWL